MPLSASEQSVDVRHTVGTPPYIPPEHLHGAPVDARGDIYSLGVTLFELLTGRRPFEAGNGMGLTEAILTAPTPRPRAFCAETPAGLDAIVYRAMARNPARPVSRGGGAGIRPEEAERGHHRRAHAVAGLAARRAAGNRRLGWIAAALVAGALAASTALVPVAGRGVPRAPPVPPGPKVVAVLPLSGASGDPQTESLAAGVADSLITTLSKVPGLTVVSRAATLKYQDRKLEPDDIAGELGATMLVDGRLQRSGDRLRITAQPARAGDQGRALAERVRRHVRRGIQPSARGGGRGGRALSLKSVPPDPPPNRRRRPTSRPLPIMRRRERSWSAPT